MNVQLLPEALDDVAFLRGCGYRGGGLLLGAEIGRWSLVERLLPLDFAAGRNDGATFAAAADRYGERLLGAFFCRRRPQAADWLGGQLVLAFGAGGIRPFTCEFAGKGKKARLLPLAEDAGRQEDAWPG